ncbi:DMT family transporter [Candidatus Pacearchaeota archaeon]|nr:DMT family transporter [Candidatus Pacearchaeota archaeon]
MFYIPIIGALVLATATILQKVILREKKINAKLFQTAGFLAAVLVMIPFIYFFWQLDSQAFELKNIIIFSFVILFSMIANLSLFYAMKREQINVLEPAIVLEPLFVILLAILFSFFVGTELFERNMNIIIPSLIAGLALILTHIKKNHIKFGRYFLLAVAGSFFFALELVFSRLILDFYSPISFYFLRCSVLFVLSFIIFKPKFEKLDTKVRWEILGLGVMWVAYRVIVYYGYINLGVVFTTLMLMLGPIFVFLFAWKFLKEKLDRRNIIAAVVIVGCVLYAMLG